MGGLVWEVVGEVYLFGECGVIDRIFCSNWVGGREVVSLPIVTKYLLLWFLSLSSWVHPQKLPSNSTLLSVII